MTHDELANTTAQLATLEEHHASLLAAVAKAPRKEVNGGSVGISEDGHSLVVTCLGVRFEMEPRRAYVDGQFVLEYPFLIATRDGREEHVWSMFLVSNSLLSTTPNEEGKFCNILLAGLPGAIIAPLASAVLKSSAFAPLKR